MDSLKDRKVSYMAWFQFLYLFVEIPTYVCDLKKEAQIGSSYV